ncbi:MAG: serine/threonine protein kinase [Kofleriaceae bacterium]
MECPACHKDVLDIDVKCGHCGVALGATGAHRMIGQIMLGQYELVDVLGQGGMSVVFKGRHKMTEQEVALKILPPELAAHHQVKSRFLDEAKALAALDHPNIVHLYNFGQEDGYFVLAMQFVEGRTWERMILEAKRLDWKESSRIAIDVLRALEYAHSRGVVHRDMKPSNVLVRSHDASATVMDFGIAKMTTSTRLTATGQTMGTVRYMSPEQVRGHEVDLRTDLYSLGATLYESLTGDTPFDGSTHFEIMTKHLSEPPKPPSALGIEVPDEVEQALMRSLAKRADDRFDSARDMRKLLELAVHKDNPRGMIETTKLNREMLGPTGAALPAPKPSTQRRVATANPGLADELEPGTSVRGPKPRPSSKRWLALAGAVLVAGGATAAMVMTRGSREPAPVTIAGMVMPVGGTFGALRVDTDGTLLPQVVAEQYHRSLARLRELAAKATPAFEIPDLIHELVSLPENRLCEPSLYNGNKPPEYCATAGFTVAITNAQRNQLLVTNDAKRLSDAITRGVAQAVCELQPLDDEAQREDRCARLEKLVKVPR